MQKANEIIDFSVNEKKNYPYNDSDYGKIEKDAKPKTVVYKKVIDKLLNNNIKIEVSNSHNVLNKETNLVLPDEISKKIYSSKFYYIIFGVITLFTSSILTMLFTVNGGIQNGFHDYALDLTDGTVQNYNVQDLMSTAETYNVEGNIQDFKTNYKRALATSLNWNLLLDNGSSNYYFLNSTDFAIDWSDVDWDHTGYYNITISSNNKFIEGETKQTIAITNHDTVDLNTLDMIALKTTPYVTTDPTAETQNLEDEALQIIKNNSSDPESITADDFDIIFSNQNSFSPASGLDLTKDYIVNTMTISANGNNNLVTGSQDINIRPQAYDLSSEDMFYESPHSAYTSMGSELSGHMMSDEPHNFNTMYLDIHDVSEQYDTPTDYIWNQQAISLMSMTNQMLASYAYSWKQNDTGSWTADVSHNDFVGGMPTPSVPSTSGVSPLAMEYDLGTMNSHYTENEVVYRFIMKNKSKTLPKNNTYKLPSIPSKNENSFLDKDGRNIFWEDDLKDNSFNKTEPLRKNFKKTDRPSWLKEKTRTKYTNLDNLPETNEGGEGMYQTLDSVFGDDSTIYEEIQGQTASEMETASETLSSGGELAPDVVEEIFNETLESVTREVAAEVAASFGAEAAEVVVQFCTWIASVISGIFNIAIIIATIILIVITFTDDDTMMLPGKISTLADEDLNNKFQEIQNSPVEYGGIPDLPNPTDTNGNFVSWNSIVTSTMTDSTVIEDWNWCPPNGTWEDRFMSWYGYSIVAKPDNGIVTGSANMHIKFYSTSGSD